MTQNKKFFLGLLLAVSAAPASALNLQGYRFSDSYRYSLLDDALMEKFDGRYVITASYGYVHSPFYYSDTYLHEKRRDIINGNNVLTGGFTYYLTDRASIGADLNAVHNQTFSTSRTSLADSVVKARFNVLKRGTFTLGLNPKVYLPTGKTANFSGMNSIGGSVSVIAEKSFNKLHLLASVGGFSAKNNAYVDVDHRQLLLTQLGVSYDLAEKWNVNAEVYRNFPTVNDTLQDDGKYFLTAKHKTHRIFSTYFGAGVTSVTNVARDTFSGFVGVKFHEPAAPVAQAVALKAAAPARVPTDEVYFAHDSADLEDNDLATLQDYVNYLNSRPVKQITLEGHASPPGPADYNMKLSERRARTVKKFFVDNGVAEGTVRVIPFGETNPQHQDEAQNRRVHVRIEE